MTNEQKLTKLLQIAVENGFVDSFSDLTIGDKSIKIVNCTVENGWTGDDKQSYSLNDLVLNWEHENLGFISGLLQETDKHFRDIYLSMMVGHSGNILTNFHINWISLPTSQRLEYLFNTFKHLL